MSESKSGFIAIVGRPNVGKSTLLNLLVGEKLAAVSPKAQTTRHRFRGIRSESEGGIDYQMIFVDMPGIHKPMEGKCLSEYCVKEAEDALQDIDIFVYMVDLSRIFLGQTPKSDEAFVIELLSKARKRNPSAPLIILLNKLDLLKDKRAEQQLQIMQELQGLDSVAIIPFSAKKKTGLAELETLIKKYLPQHPAYFPTDVLTDQNMRTIAGEHIQEQLFRLLGNEIPYECAVEIVKFSDPKGGQKKTEIHANIHVERNSQKQIVVGRGGAKIKEIGQAARQSLENLIGNSIVLKLFVKENPGWTKDFTRLKRLGYVLPELRKGKNGVVRGEF